MNSPLTAPDHLGWLTTAMMGGRTTASAAAQSSASERGMVSVPFDSGDDVEAMLRAELLQRGHPRNSVRRSPAVAEAALPLRVRIPSQRPIRAVTRIRLGKELLRDERGLDEVHPRHVRHVALPRAR